MARALSSVTTAPSSEPADAIAPSTGRNFLAFLAWPFSIVMAMRPQREREAARIAHAFRRNREETACGVSTTVTL